jgi:glycosyltransferase involved in cell wall biosynthesis
VNEILFIDDAGDDDTRSTISELQAAFPNVQLRLVRNEFRKGPSASRNIGAALAQNEFILFCDDDEYLESDYAVTCRDKLITFGAGAVSGRRVYMREGETVAQALTRFSVGSRNKPPYDRFLCELIAGAKFEGDQIVPFTNAIILTTKTLLTKFGFDDFYSRGNCYREESDYQMNL